MEKDKKSKKTYHIMIACGITLLATFVTIAFNLMINESVESKPPPVVIEGAIEFSGGHGFGEDIVYVNPAYAKPVASDNSGIEIKSQEWWITKPRESEPIYSGHGSSLDDTLQLMRETGTSGMYFLQFKVKADSGDTFRMGRNFYIVSDYEAADA